MSTATHAPISDATFSSFAFPTITVRYSGPTNTRGSRWNARLGANATSDPRPRLSRPYDHALNSGSANALPVARELLAKVMHEYGNDPADYVAIPGSLSPDEYVFTFVPLHFLTVGALAA